MTNGNSCRETLEGELTDDIHIDTSAIPESVRHRLCALTLERFNAFVAIPGNAEWLDARIAARKRPKPLSERSDEDGILPDLPALREQ